MELNCYKSVFVVQLQGTTWNLSYKSVFVVQDTTWNLSYKSVFVVQLQDDSKCNCNI